MLEEFGVNWCLMSALSDFLQTLSCIDADWLDVRGVEFVQKVDSKTFKRQLFTCVLKKMRKILVH